MGISDLSVAATKGCPKYLCRFVNQVKMGTKPATIGRATIVQYLRSELPSITATLFVLSIAPKSVLPQIGTRANRGWDDILSVLTYRLNNIGRT